MSENATATLLERERRRRQLTYQQLGDVLGVKRQSALRYCQGKQRPERGKDGEEGPAERLAVWSKGKIHAGNFDQVPAPRKRRAG